MWKSMRKKMGGTALLLVAIAVMGTSLTGCLEEDTEKTVIRVEGSTTVYPIASAAALIFNADHDDIEVQVPVGTGSGTGVKLLGQGECEIAAASREVKQSEIDAYTDVEFYDNVVAYDGIAIIVSKEIYDAGVTALTLDEVIDIYDGTITNWQDVGGPDKSIAVNEREEGSGTRDTFMEILDLETTAATNAWQSNSLVQSTVESADNGIGYVGLGYVSTDTPGVTLDGFDPTAANVKSGDYPISRSLHMYTDGAPTGAVKEFIEFIRGDEGQDIVEDKGFIRID
jgi:phosphate transport system substrate-binding protein